MYHVLQWVCSGKTQVLICCAKLYSQLSFAFTGQMEICLYRQSEHPHAIQETFCCTVNGELDVLSEIKTLLTSHQETGKTRVSLSFFLEVTHCQPAVGGCPGTGARTAACRRTRATGELVLFAWSTAPLTTSQRQHMGEYPRKHGHVALLEPTVSSSSFLRVTHHSRF